MSHHKHIFSQDQSSFTPAQQESNLKGQESCLEAGLYVVATPIGNLEDITLRAIRILKNVDVVFCEDTRQTQKLLTAYGIEPKKLMTYHEHNGEKMRPHILERLSQKQSLALISDAGTPLISDPGYKLVVEARRQGTKVIPIPGASSITAALSAGGVPSNQFLFAGFLPAKSGQRVKKLTDIASLTQTTLIFLEAPHRLQDFVDDAFAVLGDREVVVAREITKRFEQFWQGTLGSLQTYLATEEAFRGEIVVLVSPMSDEMAKPKEETLMQLLEKFMETMSLKEAVKTVQEATKSTRSEIYDLALQIKKTKEEEKGDSSPHQDIELS